VVVKPDDTVLLKLKPCFNSAGPKVPANCPWNTQWQVRTHRSTLHWTYDHMGGKWSNQREL